MSLAVGAAHAQYAAGIRTDATQRIRPFILLGIPLDTAKWIRVQ